MSTRKPVPDLDNKWTCYCHSGIKKSINILEGNMDSVLLALDGRVKYRVFNLLIVVLLVVLGGIITLSWANYKAITDVSTSVIIIKHDVKKLERSINGGGIYDLEENE